MLESLLNELRTEGHLRGEVSPPQSNEAGVSYWIIALQIIGGWLAAVFMLFFLGMGIAPQIKGAADWVVVGLMMTALSGLLMGRSVESGHSGTMVLRQFLAGRQSGREWRADCRRQPARQGRGRNRLRHDGPLRERTVVVGGVDAAPSGGLKWIP